MIFFIICKIKFNISFYWVQLLVSVISINLELISIAMIVFLIKNSKCNFINFSWNYVPLL